MSGRVSVVRAVACAAGASALVTVVGMVVLPALVVGAQSGAGGPVALWAGAAVAGLGGAGVLLAMLVRAVDGAAGLGEPAGSRRMRVRRAVRALVTVAGVVLGTAVGCGAVLAVAAAGVGMVPVETVRSAAVVVGGLGALASAPVVLVLVMAGVSGADVWDRAVWRLIGRRYAGVAVVVLLATAVGAGCTWVSSVVPDVGAVVVRGVLLAVVGALALWLGVRVVVSGSGDAWGRVVEKLAGAGRRVAPAGVGLTTVVVSMALVMSLTPSGVAHADPVEPPAPAPGAPTPPVTTEPVGDPVTTAPQDEGTDTTVVRDPYAWYALPDQPGPVIEAGDGWVTYATDRRTFETVVGGVQQTYVDDQGAVRLVDNTWVPDPAMGTVVNAANDFTVSVPVSGDATGVTFSRDGFSVTLTPVAGDFSHPVAQGNAVLFNNVFDGIDVQYTLVGAVVKEDIVVTRAVTVPMIEYVVSTTGRLVLDASAPGALLARAGESRDNVGAGDVVFSLSAPAMMDAGAAYSDAVSLTADVTGETAAVTVTADQAWIDDPARVFPIRIDPTVQVTPSLFTVVDVEEATPDMVIGDNGFPYAGYDDGVVSGNIASYNIALLKTRTYVDIGYDFTQISPDAVITSASFTLNQNTDWSGGQTVFDLYRVTGPWDPATITWNNQTSLPGSYVASVSARLTPALAWDVRDVVTNWMQGQPQHGFRVQAQDEQGMQAEVFLNSASAWPPTLSFTWSIPDPVPVTTPLDTTVTLRPVTESSMAGKQIVDGVFADGLTTPAAWVAYVLTPAGQTGVTQASASYKYPNSSAWDATLPDGTKYADKVSNWQTGLYGNLAYDTAYQVEAVASLGGATGAKATSDRFLIYQAKATDTLPSIAAWYGVPLTTVMADNHVQDTLVAEGNTLFIRNPGTTTPYNPSTLSVAQKKLIDSALMGRGLHCEYGYEPVNLNTGDFWLSATDVSVPEASGAFTVTRSYNSLGERPQSVFGYGWQFEYAQHLSASPDGSLLWTAPDGKIVAFTPAGSGLYTGPAGLGLSIRATATGYALTAQDGTVSSFDAWGSLRTVTDPLGSTTTLGYDTDLNLVKVTSPSGVVVTFTHDARGRITGVGRPGGVNLSYTYSAAGDLVSARDANANTVSYAYDAQHRMVSWTDQNGVVVVRNTYDDLGRVVAQKDGLGHTSTLAYAAGKTVATDALGHVTTYLMDAAGRTTGIVYADGYTVSRSYDAANNLVKDESGAYTYDARGNRLSATDLTGHTTTWTYDAANRVVAATDADGVTTSYTYGTAGDLVKSSSPAGTDSYAWDASHRLVSHTDGTGATESFAYAGASPAPVTHTDFGGAVWQTAYNPMRQITAVTDPLGGLTRWMYDAAGNQTGYQGADGAYTQWVLDKVGNPVTVVDPNGHATAVTYDAMRRITTVTDPNGSLTTNVYDANGNLVKETNGLGQSTTHTYDLRDRLVGSVDALGGTWAYAYDNQGNVTSVTDAAGAVTSYTYDVGLGARTSATDPLGRTQAWAYTPAGRIATATDTAGAVTAYTYGVDGRVHQMNEPGGKLTALSYDQAGNVVKLVVAGATTTYTYDKGNHLVSSVDARGQSASYTYDAAGRLTAVTNEAGETTAYTLDGVGRVLTVTDAEGGVVTQAYDKAGNVVAVTDAVGNATTYTYDAMNHLTSRKDATGAVTTWAWDAAENTTSKTDPYGGITAYTYDAMSRLTGLTDPLGRTTSYAVDAVGRVTGVTDPAGYTAGIAYDKSGLPVKVTQPNGLVTTYAYDKAGRVASTSTSLGAVTSYAYDEASRVVSMTDPVGRVATWSYDTAGNLVAQEGADGVDVAYTVDPLGFVTAATNSVSGTVGLDRDPMGRLVAQTDPLGAVTAYTYDKVGRVTSVTDPDGATTTYAYDAQGNLTAVTDAAGATTAYAYDAGNRPVTVTDANGHATTYAYDGLDRLTALTRPAGDTTTYGYDLAGQLVRVTDGLGGVTGYTYDPRGLVATLTDPAGAVTRYAWDAVGNVASVTDPVGRVTGYTYDQGQRLTAVTDPAGSTYAYTYDLVDRLTSVTSPLGYSRAFSFDPAGNIAQVTDSLGRVSTYTWDGLHNLVSATDPVGAVTSFAYDALGRTTSTTDDQGNTWAYSYDPAGYLTQTTDPLGQVTGYTYDAVGRLVASTTPSGAMTGFSYDKVGNLAMVTDPLGHATGYGYDANDRLVATADMAGQETGYTWNALDQLTGVTDQTDAMTAYAYDPVGHLTAATDPVGNVTGYAYDAAGQLTSTTDGVGGTWSYGYDALGNLTSVTDAMNRVTSLTYDAESNLTSVTSPLGVVERWTYDPASRLATGVKPGGVTASYDWDAVDRLVDVSYTGSGESNATYGYDSLGRRVAMDDHTGQSTYSYDGLGRLTLVTQGDGRSVSYTYTADGRIGQIGYPDGTSVGYGYDADGKLVSVTDPAGTSTYTYDQTDRVTGLTRADGTTTTYGYDERGAVVSVVNQAADGSLLSGFAYTYLATGQIGSETQTWSDTTGVVQVVREFTYDQNQRLVSYTETEPAPVVVALTAAPAAGPGQAPGAGTQTVSYSYDAAGNRVGAVRTLPGGVTLESVAYSYDQDDKLVSSRSSLYGVTTYSYSADGLLTGVSNRDTGVVSYEWTAAGRLQAVRAGGTLLMATSYDGDGNLVFMVQARPVDASGRAVVVTPPPPKPVPVAPTGGSVFTWRDDEVLASPGGVFWYGFAQAVAAQVGGLNGGLSLVVMRDLADGYASVRIPIPEDSGLDSSDVASLAQAGVTPRDVQDVVTDIQARVVVPVPSTTVVSTSVSGYSWDVTHFVNDINRVNTQVLAEYGASGALSADYTYGLGRVDVRATGVSGTTEWLTDGTPMTGWYLPDGRGSVAGVVRSGSLGSVEGLVSSYSYDPWGVPSSAGVSSTYGWNAELYSPVTGLQFLQSRWYEPTWGRFLSPDRVLGSVSQPASWNSYAYAWDDPVNRVDPSGMWPQFLDNLVSNIASTVTSAASTVKTVVESGLSLLNSTVVQPAVKAAATTAVSLGRVIVPAVKTVTTAAASVAASVVTPVVGWVEPSVVKPAGAAVSNAVGSLGSTVARVGQTVSGAVGVTSAVVGQAYRSTTPYVAQRLVELTRMARAIVCGPAHRLPTGPVVQPHSGVLTCLGCTGAVNVNWGEFWRQIQNAGVDIGNWFASMGNAWSVNPHLFWQTVGGLAVMDVGGALVVEGAGVTATGVGALPGGIEAALGTGLLYLGYGWFMDAWQPTTQYANAHPQAPYTHVPPATEKGPKTESEKAPATGGAAGGSGGKLPPRPPVNLPTPSPEPTPTSSPSQSWGDWPTQDPNNPNCEQVAEEIQQRIGGEIHHIRPRPPDPTLGPSQNNTGPDPWFYHDVVVKNGRVYDGTTGPAGMPIDAYKAMFEFADVLDWGGF